MSIHIVDRVSDASPLYILSSQYTCSTSLTILPSESRTLSALGSGSTKVRQTDARSTVFRGGSGSVWIYGFWRGWSINLEKGFGFCTGVGRLWGSSGLQERQRYWYRSTGSLEFQHLGLTKKVYSRSSTGTVFPTRPRGLFLGNIGNW